MNVNVMGKADAHAIITFSRLSFGLPSCVAPSRTSCGGGATSRRRHQLLDVQQTGPLFRNSVNYTVARLIEDHTCIGGEDIDLHLLIRNILRAPFMQNTISDRLNSRATACLTSCVNGVERGRWIIANGLPMSWGLCEEIQRDKRESHIGV
jgi:hypothetical protein